MLVPNPLKNQKNVLKMRKQHLKSYKTTQIFENIEAWGRLRKVALRFEAEHSTLKNQNQILIFEGKKRSLVAYEELRF
jgi:hypothetical protein